MEQINISISYWSKKAVQCSLDEVTTVNGCIWGIFFSTKSGEIGTRTYCLLFIASCYPKGYSRAPFMQYFVFVIAECRPLAPCATLFHCVEFRHQASVSSYLSPDNGLMYTSICTITGVMSLYITWYSMIHHVLCICLSWGELIIDFMTHFINDCVAWIGKIFTSAWTFAKHGCIRSINENESECQSHKSICIYKCWPCLWIHKWPDQIQTPGFLSLYHININIPHPTILRDRKRQLTDAKAVLFKQVLI